MSKTDTVSPLRQRMIEDMAARKLNPHTQRSHISSCKRFAAWLKRSPDTATADEVRRFQLHLIESGASICNRNRIMTGVRFLFRVTLRRHDLAAEIWHLKEPQTLPPVLSPEEVKRVLTMATSLKARAMLTLAYGCGLRASEVVRLRACDIDSEQMIIRIVQSKGRKDRNVMLPAEILDLLRRWWKSRPTRRDAGVAPEQRWLFPGRIDRHPTTARQFGRLFKEAAKAAGLRKAVSLHSLRHSFATHLLEDGKDIRLIQALLGHEKLDTTARYTRVATGLIAKIESPLARLSPPRRKPPRRHKAPFTGPKQVLRYLSRYTHRVAISNRRLIAADDAGVAFRWKDYRIDGPGRWKTMRLHPHEFIRRLLLHVLPKGFHRIRHYGLFANANRAETIATARALLGADPPAADPQQQSDILPIAPRVLPCPCPRCGDRMIVIEVFARGCKPRWRPTPTTSDTS